MYPFLTFKLMELVSVAGMGQNSVSASAHHLSISLKDKKEDAMLIPEVLWKSVKATLNIKDDSMIRGKLYGDVVLSRENFESIVETLYLCSTPGMRESILAARGEKLEECVKHLDW